MSLHTQIKNEIKEAMKAHDAVRLTVVRGLTTLFTNELVATKRTPQDELTDDEVLTVIRRAVKQRKDSIEQYKNGGRDDLAVDEEAELAVLVTYLPAQMTREEVTTYIQNKIAEVGMPDKGGTGKFMGLILKDLKGKTDGDMVKSVIDELVK